MNAQRKEFVENVATPDLLRKKAEETIKFLLLTDSPEKLKSSLDDLFINYLYSDIASDTEARQEMLTHYQAFSVLIEGIVDYQKTKEVCFG